MAKTAISGVTGSVTLPSGHNLRVRAWSGQQSQQVNDITGFAQAPWAANLGGLNSFRGSASGYLEFDAATTSPGLGGTATSTTVSKTGGAFTLQAGTGCTLTFTGIISNISVGQSVDGVGTGMIDFVADGAVTSSWDES